MGDEPKCESENRLVSDRLFGIVSLVVSSLMLASLISSWSFVGAVAAGWGDTSLMRVGALSLCCLLAAYYARDYRFRVFVLLAGFGMFTKSVAGTCEITGPLWSIARILLTVSWSAAARAAISLVIAPRD
jgi:hypothetical protein